MKEVKYTIISKPSSVQFECPHCQLNVEVPYADVSYYGNWNDGGYVRCPMCKKEVELGEWEYD